MRISAILILLFVAPMVSARAPDSISGLAYHSSGGATPTRSKWESIVLFQSNGRYDFPKHAQGSTINNPAITLLSPPQSGTYQYVRTGDNTAQLVLHDPTATLTDFPSDTPTVELVYELTFTDPYTGTWQRRTSGGRFYLTDRTGLRTAHVINISLRTQVGAGRPAIVGFVVPGIPFQSTNRTDLLIRVVGPSLAQFDVAEVWADPDFALVLGPSNSNAHLGDWSVSPGATSAIQKISNYVGAFPLMAGAKDAVSVVRVMPGAYTITCNPTPGDTGGEVLIEVYTLP